MKTVVIQIGNSDDKLKQAEWSFFVDKTDSLIRGLSDKVHFFGASYSASPYQNAAWVINIEDDDSELLKDELTGMRKQFNQDSIAWIEGITEFV